MNSTSELDFFTNGQLSFSASYFLITAGIAILLALLGDFYVVFNTIDSIAMIYFLFFTNVQFPNNVLDFSKFFGKYLYDFVPKPIDSVTDSSISFAYARHDYNPYFLYNSCNTLMFIAVVIILYLILKGLSYLEYFQKLRRLLFIGWEWNAPIYLLVIASNQIAFFCALQASTLTIANSFLSIFNFTSYIVCAVILIAAPFFFGYLVYRRRFDFQKPAIYRETPIRFLGLVKTLKISMEQDQENPLINLQSASNRGTYSNQLALEMNSPSVDLETNHPQFMQALQFDAYNINELQLESMSIYTAEEQVKFYRISKYLNPIIMLRRVIFAAVLVFFNDQVMISMGVIIFLNALLLVGYIVVRPYVLKIDNYRNIFIESAFIALEAINLFFDENTTSTSIPVKTGTQFTLGYCYIFICVTILFVDFIDLCYKTIRAFQDMGAKSATEQDNKVVPVSENKVQDNITEEEMYNEKPKQVEKKKEEQPIVNEPKKEQVQKEQQPVKETKKETYVEQPKKETQVEHPKKQTPPPVQEQPKPKHEQKKSESKVPENRYEQQTNNNLKEPSEVSHKYNKSGESNGEKKRESMVMQQTATSIADQPAFQKNQKMQSNSQSQPFLNTPVQSQQENFGSNRHLQMKPNAHTQSNMYNNSSNPENNLNSNHPFGAGEQYSNQQPRQFNMDADNSHSNLKPQHLSQPQIHREGAHNFNGNNSKPIPLVQEDFKVQKQRMKKALFKRNPFISQNDEQLLSEARKGSQPYL